MNNEYLFRLAEKKANKFNIYCLLIMSILGLIAVGLNELEIFTLDKATIRIAMLQLVIYGCVPAIIFLFHDYVLKKKESILELEFFKWIIIGCSFTAITVLCISATFQATLLLVIPPLMAAQYKHNRLLFIISMIASMVLIVIVTYGSFLFGEYDANLLKPLTKEEALIFDKRIEVLSNNGRALTVFTHYCLAKMFCLAVIDCIGLSITKRTTDMLNLQIELSGKVQEEIIAKTQMQNGVIEHLADIIESRDIETGEHIKRTKKYVTILVNKMRNEEQYKDFLTPKMCDNIIAAAPLHDIGKIAVSDLILCKPGKLTDEEFDKMKIHTVKGGEIINNILNELGDKEFLNVAYDIAISHHEKWNGRGYPYGKKEEEIPLPGRIMAIADVFDALVAKRVYKDPMPVDKAIGIIIGDAGTHFDPNIVEVFKTVVDDFKAVAEEQYN